MEDNNTIMKAIDYIEENLDGKLSLDEISNKVGYSKFHLNRLFSERVGCTLYKYIQTRRLTMAAEKLVYTTKPIIEIAYESNYDSQQSFTLAFRQLYLCTPQRYRIIGIHTPKLNRFTINNHLMTIYKFAVKCEGKVA
ncbi:MAG: AraC family transcriptional regulator [Oscillospiraceae bacterium]|nr:AraC family transcriptional regulator [Oscillospiraceae bacterium]